MAPCCVLLFPGYTKLKRPQCIVEREVFSSEAILQSAVFTANFANGEGICPTGFSQLIPNVRSSALALWKLWTFSFFRMKTFFCPVPGTAFPIWIVRKLAIKEREIKSFPPNSEKWTRTEIRSLEGNFWGTEWVLKRIGLKNCKFPTTLKLHGKNAKDEFCRNYIRSLIIKGRKRKIENCIDHFLLDSWAIF